MNHRGLGIAAAALALGGCMRMEAIVDKASAPQPGAGYVAAAFTITEQSERFAFGIVDALDREFVMPVSDHSRKGFGAESRLQMVALPPGDYRVAFWTFSGDRKGQHEIPRTKLLGKPFSVQAGHVVLLGKFDTRMERGIGVFTYRVDPLPLPADSAWTLLTEGYPGFKDAAIECVVCQAPAAAAGPAARPVRPDSGDFSPTHDVVIHLHRTDASDRRLGLTAWETLDGPEQRRELAHATAWTPMPSTGHDGFGESWILSDLNFKNGRVSFYVNGIERLGDKFLERSFLVGEGHEAWINEGDPRVYFSRDAADAARAR